MREQLDTWNLHLFDDGPLDDSRLGRAIQESVPEINQRVHRDEWRADLKRRVRERIARDAH